MVEIREFHPWHLDMIIKDKTIETVTDPGKLAKLLTNGMGITVYHDNRILACMGVYSLWPGVGEAWLICSEMVRTHPKTLLKTARIWLRRAFYSMELVRVQADVESSLDGARTFLGHLGFQFEGLRHKYCQGKDYIHCAIVR